MFLLALGGPISFGLPYGLLDALQRVVNTHKGVLLEQMLDLGKFVMRDVVQFHGVTSIAD